MSTIAPAGRAGAAAARRPVDASMDLLRTIQQEALEPEYRQHGRRAARPGRWGRAGAVGLALVAALVTVAAMQTSRQAPAASSERADLVQQVDAAQANQASLRAAIASLNAEILRLQAQQAPAQDRDLRTQGAVAGQSAVTGPGIVVVTDDAPDDSGTTPAQVTDLDLRKLVNGLWSAGAEAVSVNGHRVTARTAIRQAGSAITVDYTSLTRPYRVEAIGDPDPLASAFAASAGGRWWSFLRANEGVGYTVTTASNLSLPGDATLTTAVAKARP